MLPVGGDPTEHREVSLQSETFKALYIVFLQHRLQIGGTDMDCPEAERDMLRLQLQEEVVPVPGVMHAVENTSHTGNTSLTHGRVTQAASTRAPLCQDQVGFTAVIL